MVRILHFSDVHLSTPYAQLPGRRLLNKRLIGFANLVVRRGRQFALAARKVEALARFREELAADLVLNTGDLTALGTEPELRFARERMEPFTRAPLGLVVVPGNHDLYIRDSLDEGWFDRHFADLVPDDAPDLRTDGLFPGIRLPDAPVAIVCLNSARPNPQPWLSSGHINPLQIEGLARAVEDPRLRDRVVVVATHYAPRLANGRPDAPRHGLENADALFAACRSIRRGFISFGHVHRCFHVRVPDVGIPLFGAGSATHAGREGLWLYDVALDRITATPGRWTGDRYALDDASRISWSV